MIISRAKYKEILIEIGELQNMNIQLGTKLLLKQKELEQAQKKIKSLSKLVDKLSEEKERK